MRSTSRRKNRRKKKSRNAKSQKRKRSRQRLKRSSPREKNQSPKLPLRNKRNPPQHRPKKRSRKSGVGSDESRATANVSCRGFRTVLVDAMVRRESIERIRC